VSFLKVIDELAGVKENTVGCFLSGCHDPGSMGRAGAIYLLGSMKLVGISPENNRMPSPLMMGKRLGLQLSNYSSLKKRLTGAESSSTQAQQIALWACCGLNCGFRRAAEIPVPRVPSPDPNFLAHHSVHYLPCVFKGRMQTKGFFALTVATAASQ
jgi:hypothetical protein